jgi:serine/threonine-protein phosphatase 5
MSSGGALRTQGNEAFRQKQYFEAYRLFLAAIEKYPQTARGELSQAYTQLSATELILEKCPDAIRSATKAIEYDKSNYRAYYRRGNAYLECGSIQEAYTDYEAAVQMQPDEQYIKQRLQLAKASLQQLGKFNDTPAPEPAKTAPPVTRPAPDPSPVKKPAPPSTPLKKPPPATSTPLKKPAPPTTPLTKTVTPSAAATPARSAEPEGKYTAAYAIQLQRDLIEDRRPSAADFRDLIANADQLHRRMPNVVSIRVEKKIYVVGDTHGQFQDVITIFDKLGRPSAQNPYLFNGDIVDRGSMGVEILTLILAWKLADPDSIFINRGNQYALRRRPFWLLFGRI